MIWFAWHSLPGISPRPFSFARKGRNEERWLLTKLRGRWGWLALLLLADAWCDVVLFPICRAFLEIWALFSSESSLSAYIYSKKRECKSQRRKGILRSRFLKKTEDPIEKQWNQKGQSRRRLSAHKNVLSFQFRIYRICMHHASLTGQCVDNNDNNSIKYKWPVCGTSPFINEMFAHAVSEGMKEWNPKATFWGFVLKALELGLQDDWSSWHRGDDTGPGIGLSSGIKAWNKA